MDETRFGSPGCMRAVFTAQSFSPKLDSAPHRRPDRRHQGEVLHVESRGLCQASGLP